MADQRQYARYYYHQPWEVSALLLMAAAVVVALDSRGLVDRATQMRAGPLREHCLTVARWIDEQAQASGLDLPGRTVHAVFIEATQPRARVTATRYCRPVASQVEAAAPEVAATTAPPAAEPHYTTERPLRVLLLGDSQMKRLDGVLQAALGSEPAVEVVPDWQDGSGLSRPDHRDWPAHVRELLAAERYDAAVVFIGTCDPQDITEAGQVYEALTPEWVEVYQRRVVDLVEALAGQVSHVYWVGLPRMRSPQLDQGIRQVARLHYQVCAERPNVRYINGWGLLSGPDGEYTSRLPIRGRLTQVRTADGIHCTIAGSQLLARAIVERIRADAWPAAVDGGAEAAFAAP